MRGGGALHAGRASATQSKPTTLTHIRNIFAKLGADSRVEVARIIERTDRLSEART